MIIAVAERPHDPSLPAAEVLRLKRYWREDRTFAMIQYEAMPRGVTRNNLVKMLGFEPARIINLMWPDRRSGTWDRGEAAVSARHLSRWIDGSPHVTGVVLLGRRVGDAFGWKGMPFGFHLRTAYLSGRCSHEILLPHPSGRSRVLNNPTERQRIASEIKNFVESCA